jgi:hypothetical protein
MCNSLGKAGTYFRKIPLPPLLFRMSKVEYLITQHPVYDQTLDLFTNGLMTMHQGGTIDEPSSDGLDTWRGKNKSAQSLDSVLHML